MEYSHSTRTSLLSVILVANGFFSGLGPSARGDESPSEIFAQMHRQFTEMESIRVTSKRILYYGDVRPELDWTISDLRARVPQDTEIMEQRSEFIWKRGQFRNSYELGSATPEVRVYAYNLKAYQMFGPAERAIELNREPEKDLQPYFVPPAVLDPYEFIFIGARSSISFETLAADAVWQTLADGAQVAGERLIGDTPCVVMDLVLPEPGSNTLTRIYLARDQGYFPLRYERFSGDQMTRAFQAEDIVEVKSPGGRVYYFAGRTLSQSFHESGQPLGGSICELELSSLQLDQEVPDSTFTIPVSLARYVRDENAGTYVDLGDERSVVDDTMEATEATSSDAESPGTADVSPTTVDAPLKDGVDRGRKSFRGVLLLISGTALLLVGASVLGLRRRRAARRPPENP